MSTRMRQLLQERKLAKARITKEMVQKEIGAAQSDLDDARVSLNLGKLKWATIQGYFPCSIVQGHSFIVRATERKVIMHYQWPSKNYSLIILVPQ